MQKIIPGRLSSGGREYRLDEAGDSILATINHDRNVKELPSAFFVESIELFGA